jgi:hypothetical protein
MGLIFFSLSSSDTSSFLFSLLRFMSEFVKYHRAYLISHSRRPSKKFKIVEIGGQGKAIFCGNPQLRDFLSKREDEKDEERLNIQRMIYDAQNHGKYESFTHTPEFWNRWLCWNHSSLQACIRSIQERFHIKVLMD